MYDGFTCKRVVYQKTIHTYYVRGDDEETHVFDREGPRYNFDDLKKIEMESIMLEDGRVIPWLWPNDKVVWLNEGEMKDFVDLTWDFSLWTELGNEIIDLEFQLKINMKEKLFTIICPKKNVLHVGLNFHFTNRSVYTK